MQRVWLSVSGVAAVIAAVVILAMTGVTAGEAGASTGLAADPSPDPSPSATPSLTLTATPGALTAGDAVRLTARLGVAGQALRLSRRVGETAGFSPVSELFTGATGAVAWRLRPRATTTFRVEYAGNDEWLPASADVTVTVRPLIRLTAPTRVTKGASARLGLRVAPAHPGSVVTIELWRDGGWVRWRDVRLNSESRRVIRWRADRVGRQPVRVTMAADEAHAAGRSAVRRIRVVKLNPYGVPVTLKRIVVVDKSQYRLHFYSYGREIRSFPCVLGRPGLPTPLGRFRIYAKGMWPGGPFGARIMSYHSPYAIHGTNEPHLLSRFPRNFSHGCTRLANANAVWLYDHAPVGTPVWNVP